MLIKEIINNSKNNPNLNSINNNNNLDEYNNNSNSIRRKIMTSDLRNPFL